MRARWLIFGFLVFALTGCALAGGDNQKPPPIADGPGCTFDSFQCQSGECISGVLICDGTDQCADGSDEAGCLAPPTTCAGVTCPDGSCVDDSSQCPAEETCNEATQFECGDGSCIPKSRVCNLGIEDCPSGEDEENCNSGCQFHEFECGNNRCLPLFFRCDGEIDCAGGEDEASCP